MREGGLQARGGATKSSRTCTRVRDKRSLTLLWFYLTLRNNNIIVRVYILGPATVAIDSRVLLSFWPFGDRGGTRYIKLTKSDDI